MPDSPYIGRIVALLAPFIAAATAFIANGVQDIFNFDLNDANLTVFITGAVVAVLGIIYKWLDNRGAYERLVQAGTEIYEGGKRYAPPPQEPPAK